MDEPISRFNARYIWILSTQNKHIRIEVENQHNFFKNILEIQTLKSKTDLEIDFKSKKLI